jgi:diadenosine tetraphosphate (Ap4A) HIT family hydrolase
MKAKNIYSHLTAKERDKMSFPMKRLKRLGLLTGEILDFGCGYGLDIDILSKEGFNITGFDKYYQKKYPTKKFDTITCIYVLNVLDSLEQSDVLMSVSELLKPGGKAFFVVRRDIKHEGFRMHFIHKKPTYQTNVKLPFESIYKSDSCEIYEYQHYNVVSNKESECVFCVPKKEIILETALTYAVFDKFPVNRGHTLIIPKSHKSNYFDLGLNEQISLNLVINRIKMVIDEKFNPDGYNIGINIGEYAGQTIDHVHVHLIPRYKNDVKNPIGGVRNVIPDKGDYLKKK